MNIGIIGGGSIGLLFASYLAENGHAVTLYTKTEEQAILLQTEGILLQKDASQSRLHVDAHVITQGIRDHDLLIITVKQYHLSSLTPILLSLPSRIPLLFVQNGMGHLNLLERLPQANIMVGIVEHGALRRNSNTVVHSGEGVTKVSVFRGAEFNKELFSDACSNPSFPVEVKQDWYEMLITKLVVNSMINPLTALLRVENGQLLSNPHFYQLFTNLYQEIVKILKPDNPNDWWEIVVSVCKKTAKNRSSMLRDIEQLKETEIDGIIGYFHTLPTYSDNDTPILDFLYTAVKGLEN
ncbi:2-dehydropantoate 2-reductase [Bacillus mesophilus]|uniref:2-dehydropantoate 2-reductase n=1 Tax=Bacillus mesophilus TaxID=1808955 RepID=A0A6M0Q1X3_9BACI|nr:2-dehydropantoate 2-reductase [Bacillus mesophilus]MBM7659468.1 2-dehydropantoate 2-reductase [Bacillus mesophilus]NEY70341.1 2-dehydropantoate 2-reductase [Bacillus mesophilus]